MCNNSEDCKCIFEILKTIHILQENAECNDTCLDSCDRGFLGCGLPTVRCNTRPIMLYTGCGNGVAWSMPVDRSNNDQCTRSSVFRVEKIDGCCCTCRVLAPCHGTDSESEFVATNTFFTIDLKCICAIRCLDDTFVCI